MDFGPVLALLMLAPWPEGNPPLCDLMMFPNAESVRASLEVAEKHRIWVYEQYMTPPCPAPSDQFWLCWLRDCAEHSAPWKRLKEAQDGTQSEQSRRTSLAELKQALGDKYGSGCLPCPVPLERLQRIHEP